MMLLLQIAGDVGFTFRLCRRNVAFAVTLIGILAVAIGACTAMYTVAHTVLVRPLPYDRPDQIVSLRTLSRKPGGLISAPDLIDLRDRTTAFSALAIWLRSVAVVSGLREPEQVSTMDVSTAFFSAAGVRPLYGRTFLPGEESRTSDVVVLSYRIWKANFAGDPAVVGRSILVDGQSATVIGVVPPVFDQNLDAQLFRPFNFNAPHASVRAYHTYPVIGRLNSGVSLQQAETQLNRAADELGKTYPEDADNHVAIQPYVDTVIGGARSQLLYLLAAVVIVLLIACGNIASLMLTRATGRQHEMATRVAIGASRGRLIQQALTESVTITLVGGIIGLAFAALTLSALRNGGAAIVPRAAEVTLDIGAVGFALAVSLIAGVVVGVGSAIRSAATAARPSLNTGYAGSHTQRGSRLRRVVIMLQVAGSLVLVVAAATLLDSYWRLSHTGMGFDTDGLLTATISLPASRYTTQAQHDFWNRFLDRVRALPHVTAASAASKLPLDPYPGGARYAPAGANAAFDASLHARNAQFSAVADGYFESMRISILAGKSFRLEDVNGKMPIVVVSQSIARRFPLGIVGTQLTFADYDGLTAQVIGVANDVRPAQPGGTPAEIVYFASAQMPGWERMMSLALRTDCDATSIVSAVRSELFRLDPSLALGDVRPMADVVGRPLARRKLETSVLLTFGCTALLLAAFGLYGMLAYGVATREREFSIRYALGARVGQLFGGVLRDGMTTVVCGIALGLLLLPSTTGALRNVFAIGVVRTEVIILAAGILALAGACACIVPGAHATRLGTTWRGNRG